MQVPAAFLGKIYDKQVYLLRNVYVVYVIL
jgi:hypothetical protein